MSFLKYDTLKGKTFLDIGCGSGINSAAAWLAKAEKIYSFDYDPDSVTATRQLHAFHGSPANWKIAHGSILDAEYLKTLGAFDIVYAWGMLHHTGDQWQALRNTAELMHEHSLLYIALYAKETQFPDWQYWIDVKQRYNRSGKVAKCVMEAQYIWQIILGKKFRNVFTLPRIMWQYQNARGMHFMTDVRDWLGGWPTEFSSVPETVTFADRELGLALVNLRTGEANSEFLFAPKATAASMGYDPVDFKEHQFSIPVFDNTDLLDPKPVWIFGTARGGDLIFDFLTNQGIAVAGFIDLERQKDKLHDVPVVALDEFTENHPKSTQIILANRYVKENAERLHKAGFYALYNGHPLIIKLHYNHPA